MLCKNVSMNIRMMSEKKRMERKTYQLLLNTPSIPSWSHSPLACCRRMMSLTARSIGSRFG